jgi:hypothetical protein
VPDGTATLTITLNVDIHRWAQKHGATLEDAQRELRQRVDGSTHAATAVIVEALGDLDIQSVGIATG